MARKTETRNVVAAEWRSQDGEVVRGEIISRTKSSARVKWSSNGRVELVHFDDPELTFLTAEELT